MTCRRLWCSGLNSRLGTCTCAAVQLLSKHLWWFVVAVAVPSILSVLKQVSIANASYFYANKVVANWNSISPYKFYVYYCYYYYYYYYMNFMCKVSVFLIAYSGVLEMVVTQHIRILSAFLWNLNVYTFFLKPSVDPILSQQHPIRTFISNFIKIIISVILSSTTWPVKCFLLLQIFFFTTVCMSFLSGQDFLYPFVALSEVQVFYSCKYLIIRFVRRKWE